MKKIRGSKKAIPGMPCAATALLMIVLPLLSRAEAVTAAQARKPASQSPAAPHRHHSHEAQPESEEKKSAAKSIPELELFSQEGKKVRFREELLAGKTVVISFIYTSCGNVCPMLAGNFSKLQNLLGDRQGRDVSLISISTDPATDTPERLKEWSKMFDAQPGWTFVTGPKAEMDRLVTALIGYSPNKGMHDPIVLIGNQDKGRWTTAYGLASPERLLNIIDETAAP